jgi:hydrogenase-4 membrane subunit HyfE
MILFCISLINPDQKERQNTYFIMIGFIWGLALLTKTTAMVLAPVLLMVIAFHTSLIHKPLRLMIKPAVLVFGFSALIAGWYYFRNYMELGSPFTGIYDRLQMLYWWQEPGYRTWSQILFFGQSLAYPVYSGVTSFGDAFYSTLWLDGFISGVIDFVPWNENFMIAGALLALVPSIFMMTGIVSACLDRKNVYRNALIFSIGIIVLLVAVMIDLYMVRTGYSVPKASYKLGLLPCYAIIVSAGAEPFLRNKIIRSFALACFACWAFAAYAAYFVTGFQ